MRYSRRLESKYKPKTQRTIKLLNQNKTEDLKWDLDTITDIDLRLSQFCEKIKEDQFAQSEGLIKVQMENNQKQEQHNHKLLNHFGEVLIQTAFQGLSIKEKENVKKNEMEIATINVLKTFDINPQSFSLLKKEERLSLLKKQMNDTIDKMLKGWSERIQQKENKMKEQDQQEQSEKKQDEKRRSHLKWLKIKSQHDSLQYSLKSIVLFYLSKYENQLKTNEKQSLRKNQFTLKAVPFITTREVFDNMEVQGNGNFSHFLRNLSQDRVRRIKNKQIKEEEPKNKSQTQFQNIKFSWTPELEKEFVHRRNLSKNLFSSEVKSSNFNLSSFQPYQQTLIKESRKSGRRAELLMRYADGEELNEMELEFLANTSELLNRCVDQRFVQASVNQINREQLQNQKMELNIAEDIILQQDILKRIVYQGRLAFLKKKIRKEKMYVNNAQEMSAKNKIRNENKQLSSKHIKVLTKIIQKMEKEGEFKQNLPKDVPGASLLNKFLENKISARKLLEEFKLLIQQDEIKQAENELNHQKNNYISEGQSLFDRIKQLKKYSKKNVQTQYIEKLRQPIQSYGETELDRFKLKRHIYHPPSKIYVEKKKDISDEEEDNQQEVQNIIQQQNERKRKLNELNFFNLTKKTASSLRNRMIFQKFYSGGPMSQGTKCNLFNLKPTEIELKAIVIIQKWARRFIQSRLVKQQITNKQNDVYFFYNVKKNLENIWNILEIEKDENQAAQQVHSKLQQIVNQAYNKMNIIDQKKYLKHSQYYPIVTDRSEQQTNSMEQIRSLSINQTSKHKRINTQTTQINSSISTNEIDNLISLNSTLKTRKLLIAGQKNIPMIVTTSGFNFNSKEINIQDPKGNTALHYATLYNNKDFTAWLISRKADPNIQNYEGNTPIHFAFSNSSVEIFNILLEAKPNLNLANKKGETPLAFANQKFLIQFDLNKGNSHILQQRDAQGNSQKIIPLQYAQDNNLLIQRKGINNQIQTLQDDLLLFSKNKEFQNE